MDSKYYIWILVGIIAAIYLIVNKISKDIIAEKKSLLNLKNDLDRREQELFQKQLDLNSKTEYISKKERELNQIISEKTQDFPYLASILADWEHMHETLISEMLSKKKRPAIKAAEKIRQISREKRIISKKCRAFENQIKMYESLFP